MDNNQFELGDLFLKRKEMLMLRFCGSTLITSVLTMLESHCRVLTPLLLASLVIPPEFSVKAPGGM